MTGRKRPETTESWLVQMDEMRRMASRIGRFAAVLAHETNALLGQLDEDGVGTGELASATDSAEVWAAQTDGDRDEKSLAEYFETTRNCLHEAIWILDNARLTLREERPELLGEPPAWA